MNRCRGERSGKGPENAERICPQKSRLALGPHAVSREAGIAHIQKRVERRVLNRIARGKVVERRIQTLCSPQEAGSGGWHGLAWETVPGGRKARTHALGRSLAEVWESHRPIAPIGGGRAKPVFWRPRGNMVGPPGEDGLASGGRWNGALRGGPLERALPHGVGAHGEAFPV